MTYDMSLTMTYDMSLTMTYVVILDLAVTFRFGNVLRGKTLFQFDSKHKCRVGLMRRSLFGDTATTLNDVVWCTLLFCISHDQCV